MITYNRKWRVDGLKFKTREEAEEYLASKSQEETSSPTELIPSQDSLDFQSSPISIY